MREPDWPTARRLAAAGQPLTAQQVPLADADGHVLAQAALALTDLPAFDTSSMDGWAVCGEGPWTVVGEVLAGHAPDVELSSGQCCVIATGAAVPDGTSAIVRRENGELTDGRLTAAHVPGADIRPAGEECRRGEVLAQSGELVGPALIGLLQLRFGNAQILIGGSGNGLLIRRLCGSHIGACGFQIFFADFNLQ